MILKEKIILMWVCFDEKMHIFNILTSKWHWNIFFEFSKNSVAETCLKSKYLKSVFNNTYKGKLLWIPKTMINYLPRAFSGSRSNIPYFLYTKRMKIEACNQVILKDKIISMCVCFDEKMYRSNILSSKWPWNIFQFFSKNSVAQMVWKRKFGNILLTYASKGKHLLTHKSPLSYLSRSDFDLGVI